MKPMTVISIAVLALAGAATYAVLGGDEGPVTVPDTKLNQNVNGLFGKLTSQATGTLASPPPAPTGKMLVYESEKDLYQYYLQFKEAKDPSRVFQAYRAFSSCQSLLANKNSLQQALDMADGQPGMNRERRMAINELISRCKGFERMSERETQEAGNALREKAKLLGSAEMRLENDAADAQVDRDTMIELMRSNSSSAFERGTPAFASMLKASLNVSPDTNEAQEVDFAIMLAGCELGRDCSENALPSLIQCAYDNYCQKPLAQTWQENLSAESKKHVLELKDKVLNMLKTANFSSLR